VLGLREASSTEHVSDTIHPFIDIMVDQKKQKNLGGTMRLGAYDCQLIGKSKAREAYKSDMISERHRHRYEFNNEYKQMLEDAGMRVTGINPQTNLAEIIEIDDHPWFVTVQFHPEFKSRPLRPHPLFREFVKAAKKHNTCD